MPLIEWINILQLLKLGVIYGFVSMSWAKPKQRIKIVSEQCGYQA